MLEFYNFTASIALCSGLSWIVVIVFFAGCITFLLYRKGNYADEYLSEFMKLVENRADLSTLVCWIAHQIGGFWSFVMMVTMCFAKAFRVIFLTSFALYVIMTIMQFFGVF